MATGVFFSGAWVGQFGRMCSGSRTSFHMVMIWLDDMTFAVDWALNVNDDPCTAVLVVEFPCVLMPWVSP